MNFTNLSRRDAAWIATASLAQTFASVSADEASTAPVAALGYTDPKTSYWKFGLILKPPVTCSNIYATFPVLREWGEQKVRLVDETIDPTTTRYEKRTLQATIDQIRLTIPRVRAGERAEVTFTYEVTRSKIQTLIEREALSIPKRVDRELKFYLGNSPNIDSSHPMIRKASRELAGFEYDSDWARLEDIYDYVRDKVRYVEGPIRRASDALRTGEGDCEDMTSLFVAMCRNAGVPARMVWIPGHCYPEFYLIDEDKNGHWFPCQAAGTRAFGEMPEERPVIQKGDKFKVPESRKPLRYVSEFFRCDRSGSKDPSPVFLMKKVPAVS